MQGGKQGALSLCVEMGGGRSCPLNYGVCSFWTWATGETSYKNRMVLCAVALVGQDFLSLSLYNSQGVGRRQRQFIQEVQAACPLFVRKQAILKSLFPFFLEIVLSDWGQPSWSGCVPFGTDSYPGEVSRKCLFFISKLAFFKKNMKERH